MKYRFRITCLLALACSSAMGAEVVDYTAAENYERMCSACHGDTGRGDGPVAEVISVKVPDLTRIAARNGGEFPREALKAKIDGRDQVNAHGSGQMPVWGYSLWIDDGAGRFSDERVAEILDELVDYLESLQARP